MFTKLNISPVKRASVDRTIKSRMGGFVQTAFWEVRSEPFGSWLSQDASSKEKPRLCRTWVGAILFWVQHWVQLGPVLSSFFGVKRCRINDSCES